jgi:hypothetical protein
MSFLVLLTLPGAAFAGGNQEDEMMAEARRLIEERNLSEAGNILTTVVLNDPERLDETEALRSVIKQLSDERNARLRELIRNLTEEQDFERTLELIDEIRELDKSENPFSQQLLEEAEFAAIVGAGRERFEEIMAQGLELLSSESYGFAVENYLTGYDIRYEDFLAADYPDFLKEAVNANIDIILERGAEFVEDESAYLQTLALGRQLISTSAPSDLRNDFNSLFNRMQELASVRRSIEEAVQVLEGQLEIIRQIGNRDAFLGFAVLITRGRVAQAEQGVREGVIGSLDLIWELILDNWTDALKDNASETWQTALGQWQNSDYQGSLTNFQDLADIADMGQRVSGLWRDYLDWQENFKFSARSWDILLAELGPYKEWQTIEEMARVLSETTALTLELQDLDLASLSDDEIFLAGSQWRENQDNLEAYLDNIRTQKEVSPTLELAYGIDISTLDQWTDPAATLINQAVEDSREIQVALRREIAQRLWNPLVASSNARDDNWEEIQTLSQGIVPEDGGALQRYPNRVLDIANAEDPLWQDLIAELEEFIQSTSEEEPFILEDPVIQDLLAQAQDLLPDRREVYQAFTSLRLLNQDNFDQAQALAARANSLLVQIDSRLQNPAFNNFEGSREDLNEADDNFLRSTELQYDLEAELAFEAESNRLGDLITAGIQEEVQAFVVASVQRARSLYTNGEFRDSMDILDIANERWEFIFRDTVNPSLDNLTQLVSRALRASSGRVVGPTDPLYNEVQQLLTLAENNYLLAQRSSNRTERQEYVDEAILTLSRLRAIYPLNQEASLLQLKINQLIQTPQEFRQTLQNKYNAALEYLNPSEEGAQPDPDRAISELEDLQIVNPQFPGIERAIFNAKVAAGLITPPVSQADRNRSNALAVRARNILNAASTQAELQQALALNSEAIALWDENPVAIALTGSIAVAINIGIGDLSTADNRLLNEAIDAMRDRSYTRAQRIIDDLWSVRSNRGDQRLIETRNRLALANQN